MAKLKVLLAAMAVMAMLLLNKQESHAQQGIDPAFLAEIQGRWISRFPTHDQAVEINGTEVRVVALGKGVNDTARPGTVVAVITGIKKINQSKSLVDGRTVYNYEFMARKWTTSGGGRYFLSDESYSANFNGFTSFCRDSPSSPMTPYLDYRQLSGLWGGDMVREEHKRQTYRPDATHYSQVIEYKCSEVKGTRSDNVAAGTRGRASTSTVTAPVAPARSPVAVRPAEQPESLPVTSEQALAEIATRERLNREQVAFATKQNAENAAAKAAFEKATAEREATIAAQKAEAERKQREYEAAMAKWRADVEACQKGEISRCGQ